MEILQACKLGGCLLTYTCYGLSQKRTQNNLTFWNQSTLGQHSTARTWSEHTKTSITDQVCTSPLAISDICKQDSCRFIYKCPHPSLRVVIFTFCNPPSAHLSPPSLGLWRRGKKTIITIGKSQEVTLMNIQSSFYLGNVHCSSFLLNYKFRNSFHFTPALKC